VSVVKINVLSVPEPMRDTLEERFSSRAGEVDTTPGFESFELLRPTDDSDEYFVVTRWESDEAFQAWMDSRAFQQGHAQSGQGQRPAAADSRLLSFDVVLSAARPTG
jgi:heme-degrading monooxygenase HmoA